MTKLIALLMSVGAVVISGSQFQVVEPRPGVTRAMLVDAGMQVACDPVLISCAVRVHAACRALSDGGVLPKYLTVSRKSQLCPRNGTDVLIMQPKQVANNDCFEMTGPDACEVTGVDLNPAANEPAAIAVTTDRCACKGTGVCRVPLLDGGTPADAGAWTAGNTRVMPTGVTTSAPFAGAGCIPKPCAEIAGDQGQSWPAACAQ